MISATTPTPAVRLSGSASGGIGARMLNASYSEDNNGADLSGILGPDMVSLHESFFAGGAQISGTVSGPSGFRSVFVSVSDSSANGRVQKNFSGMIGSNPVSLQENGDGSRTWITGSSGGTWVNVDRTNSGGFTSFWGSGGMGTVSVNATAGSEARYDLLEPLFGVGG